jgi:acyl-CoA reductase-like NAD-dependent aldehyde dehydrogenase
VHSLWVPSIALRTPLVLKPGSAEPWTPARVAQAFIAAGCPPEAFSYYPCGYAGAGEILRLCGRGMVFGDAATTVQWAGDSRVERHGPGYSKVVIGDDAVDRWEDHLDVLVASVADNSGRSCVNASGIWVTRHGDAIAEALAARLARIAPRSADDPEAALAPFVDRGVAERIRHHRPGPGRGARDVTEIHRWAASWSTTAACICCRPSCDARARPPPPTGFPFRSRRTGPRSAFPEALGRRWS